jgi:tetratricopeptide (TPR) repeat protein
MSKLYVIRFNNHEESGPLAEEQVKSLIKSGKLKAEDHVSIYPNKFSIQAKAYPEFELLFDDSDKTVFIDPSKNTPKQHEEKTRILDTGLLAEREKEAKKKPVEAPDLDQHIKDEKTGSIEIPAGLKRKEVSPKPSKVKKSSFGLLAAITVFLFMYFEEEDQQELQEKNKIVMVPVRPRLPTATTKKVDPAASEKLFGEGLKFYFEDTVIGYRRASEVFHKSLTYDPQNVSALSMLASSYLNLIESSNQDEKTFSVISKLIDLSKVKDATTVETLIAEIEFLAASRRYDAAIQRLIEYSKVTGKMDPSLYFYIGWLYHLKNENSNALKYLNMIPSSALPMAKLFYLRGLIHEESNEWEDAISEYKRARKLSKNHTRSLQGILRIEEKRGQLKSQVKIIQFLTEKFSLQSPREYIETLTYRAKIALLFKNLPEAVSSLSKALQLDPKNEDIRMEYYSLLSQLVQDKKYARMAKMYAMLLEADKLAKESMTHEATTILIQAKDLFPKSEVPAEKMGDLFYRIGEFDKASSNYKLALKINPDAGFVAIKLIDSSIKNHDWDEAQKNLAKHRGKPKLKSSIDRLAGDLAFQQGQYAQATQFYLKAMARDSVDTEVYNSYANILRESDQCKDAQFFYSIAQKYDPLNVDAISGSAKCLLKTDGLKAAVSRIQDELVKLPKARADLIAAIADIHLISNEYEKAILFAEQAIEADPNYPESYRILGLSYLAQLHVKKENKKKLLDAFLAYSEKKPSDPFGYMQRFEVFLKDLSFVQAEEELNKVFEISPRYPELHLKRASMYSKMGKTKDALLELEEELKINPKMVKALDQKGFLLLQQNELDEAMKSFVRSMEIDPRNPASKLGAGQVNYLKRQFSAAIALYQAALGLDKGNPEIHKKLGQAYRESGEQDKAAAYFRNYLDLDPNAPDHQEYEKYR